MDNNKNADEKLSDEEFKKLIPHLDLHQLFLIEFENKGEWKNLYDVPPAGGKGREIFCAVCSQQIPLSDFKEHIEEKSHLDAINAVEKIYHPLYTASRDAKSDLSDTEIKSKTRKAKSIAAAIEDNKFHTTRKEPVLMSIEELLEVEIQKTKGAKCQKMLIVKGPVGEKSRYHCHICGRYSVGIITVNAHLRGNAHRILQHSVFAMRAPRNTAVNKYSVLAYGGNTVARSSSSSSNSAYVRDKRYNDAPPKKASTKRDLEGLIGVEYVARIQKSNGEDAYVCCLCHTNNIVQTAELMENHLISFKHRRQYCEKHYADTTKLFENMVNKADLPFEAGMAYILSKMAYGIEDYHGYGRPHKVSYDRYLKEKNYIATLVEGLPHACQEFGPSFSTVVSMNDLMALKNQPEGLRPRHVKTFIYNPRFTEPMRGKHYLNMVRHVSRVLQGKKDGGGEPKRGRSVSSTSSGPRLAAAEPFHGKRSQSRTESVTRTISPTRNMQQHSRKRRLTPVGESTDVWRTYRHRISASASDLDQAYHEYRIHPEKHPNYDLEWRAFWKRRKTELQQKGINYRDYDFQPEWTAYFRQRLDQLFGEKLQSIKIEIRRQLNIPLDAEEDSGGAPHVAVEQQRSYEPPRKREAPTEQRHVEVIPVKALRSSPIHDDTKMWNPPAPMERERPNIIGLLRLMTALEDHLGSTGEKILDLLTKALSLEKIYPADSLQLEERILNANNCRLIKSAQEKLRSQLYADLVESKKINSFNRVIDSADVLLDRAESMGWSSVEEPQSAPPSQHIQIEKLIEVLQDKSKYEYGAPVAAAAAVKQKSLPDTLMELMSQKQHNGPATTQHQKSSNPIDQLNYGMYVNNAAATGRTVAGSLPQQNSQFLSAGSLQNKFGNAAELNFSNLQSSVNNADVWHRLGGQADLLQRDPRNAIGRNYGAGQSINPTAPNVLGNNTNLYGGSNVSGAGTNTQIGSGAIGSGKYHPFGF